MLLQIWLDVDMAESAVQLVEKHKLENGPLCRTSAGEQEGVTLPPAGTRCSHNDCA
jgi:hypothetical protein